MAIARRDFLKKGLVATGAVGTGAVAALGCGPAPESTPAGPVNDAVALTPDGRLVQVSSAAAPRPVGLPASDPAVRVGVPGRKWMMVIDLAACDGCEKCTEACNAMHGLPPDREYIRVFKMQDSPNTAPYWFPKGCFQCDNTPCTTVCPVGATFKRQDGLVLVDNTTCIGCRFCMAACPYSTRIFNWTEPTNPPEVMGQESSPETGMPRRIGTVGKCDFCPEYLREGRLPPCADVCTMGAIYFGDEVDDSAVNGKGEHVRLSELLRDRAGFRSLEKLGTEPRVYYLPPRDRRYDPPDVLGKVAPDAAAAPAAVAGHAPAGATCGMHGTDT
jgi:molybdopterin-containing oxidoreductase family iron-sulfur binding subunit